MKTAWIGRFHVNIGSAEYERLLAAGQTVDRYEDVAVEGEADVQNDAEPTLEDLTRPQLNEKATELGIEEPDKLSNKSAVIAAIEAKLDESNGNDD